MSETMISRFCEGTAYRLLEEAHGYNSLSDDGEQYFCAWDSPEQGVFTVQLNTGVEDEELDISSGYLLDVEGQSAINIQAQLEQGFYDLESA